MSHNLAFKLSSPSAEWADVLFQTQVVNPLRRRGRRVRVGWVGGGGTALGVVPPKTPPPRAPPVAVGTVNAEIKVLSAENFVAVVEGSLNILEFF